MHPAIILDTETTDIKDPEVIELAWQTFEPADPTAAAVTGAHHRFKPTKPPAIGALATHHILMSELEGMPPASTAPARVPPARYWVGHNIDFDWKALGSPPVKRICTLAMCRRIWPNAGAHNQTAMIYFLKGATPEVRSRVLRAHGAQADIGLTAEILASIIDFEELGTWDEVYRFSEEARIPTHFSFGKFAGQPIAAADRGYANWYRRQSDPDPYLLEAFRRAGLL